MVRKRKKRSMASVRRLSVLVMVLVTLFVYYFSFDSQVHVLSCEGNYYLTDAQVYDLAGVSTKTRLYLTPTHLLENRIYDMPLVKSVDIERSGQKLTIHIKEKTVVGYYIRKGKKYMLTTDNESIEVPAEYEKTIIHFPLLSGLSASQRSEICKVFKKNKDLNRKVIEKIAEIQPYKTSFDSNMVKMTMVDGNVVYSSISGLAMMANYQAMLTKLQGESVCLLLDEENSAIDKVDCSELSSKKKSSSSSKKSSSDDSSSDDSSSDSSTESTDTTSTDETQTTDSAVTDETQTTDTTSDWTYDESTGLQYSESTGLYMDSDGTQYYWNEETQQLEPVTE